MDNLFLAIVSSFLLRKRHDGLFLLSYPASLHLDPIPEGHKKWPESTGIGGRIAPEWVAGMNRNYWPLSTGICISGIAVRFIQVIRVFLDSILLF
jgi:hypothetical protein